jgi:hypothetical protein
MGGQRADDPNTNVHLCAAPAPSSSPRTTQPQRARPVETGRRAPHRKAAARTRRSCAGTPLPSPGAGSTRAPRRAATARRPPARGARPQRAGRRGRGGGGVGRGALERGRAKRRGAAGRRVGLGAVPAGRGRRRRRRGGERARAWRARAVRARDTDGVTVTGALRSDALVTLDCSESAIAKRNSALPGMRARTVPSVEPDASEHTNTLADGSPARGARMPYADGAGARALRRGRRRGRLCAAHGRGARERHGSCCRARPVAIVVSAELGQALPAAHARGLAERVRGDHA